MLFVRKNSKSQRPPEIFKAISSGISNQISTTPHKQCYLAYTASQPTFWLPCLLPPLAFTIFPLPRWPCHHLVAHGRRFIQSLSSIGRSLKFEVCRQPTPSNRFLLQLVPASSSLLPALSVVHFCLPSQCQNPALHPRPILSALSVAATIINPPCSHHRP